MQVVSGSNGGTHLPLAKDHQMLKRSLFSIVIIRGYKIRVEHQKSIEYNPFTICLLESKFGELHMPDNFHHFSSICLVDITVCQSVNLSNILYIPIFRHISYYLQLPALMFLYCLVPFLLPLSTTFEADPQIPDNKFSYLPQLSYAYFKFSQTSKIYSCVLSQIPYRGYIIYYVIIEINREFHSYLKKPKDCQFVMPIKIPLIYEKTY